MNIFDIDTPALLISKKVMNNNISNMAFLCDKSNIKLRPHIKTHKIPEIALIQNSLSGNGIAVSKLGEAEVMISEGINDVLVANQIIGVSKIHRLGELCRKADVKVCVDSVEGIIQLEKYLPENILKVKVLLEIDTGMKRCGVNDNDAIERLINTIFNCSKLSFDGFLSHSGNIYGAKDMSEVKDIALNEITQMNDFANYWTKREVAVNTVSIGSTPAAYILHDISDSGYVSEIRPGNYVFNDNIQVRLGVAREEECALSVISTVISRPHQNRVVVDAGSKCFGLDRGAHSNQITDSYGSVKGDAESIIERLSEEHGILRVKSSDRYEIGEKIFIIPNHACAATNLFDCAYVCEDNKITDKWEIKARGKVQ